MKRAISIMMIIVTLLSVSACNMSDDTTATQYSIVPVEEYSPFLYGQGKGGVEDNVTPRYEGASFDSISPELYTESNVDTSTPIVTYTILGKELKFRYSGISQKRGNKHYRSCLCGNIAIFYDLETGIIAQYAVLSNRTDRDFSSPVTPDSSEEEFVAYAKQILLDYTGKSTEGYDVRVRTGYGQLDNTSYWVDGFERSSEEAELPQNNPCYEITFFLTIDGIECYDKLRVYVTNVGELIAMEAYSDYERYEPFENFDIDQELLERKILARAPISVGGKTVISREISNLVVIAQDNCLWAKGMAKYSWEIDDGTIWSSGNEYVVKLAECKIREN